jgi:hypothetical protein
MVNEDKNSQFTIRHSQLDIDREYLNHVLRNSTARIAGCLKEIEITLREMAAAVKTFRESITTEQFQATRNCEHTDHTEKGT